MNEQLLLQYLSPNSLFPVKANLISLADPHKSVLSSHSKSLKAWKPLAPSDYFASATLGLESPPICFHLTLHLLKFWDLPDKINYPPCIFSECFFYPYFIPFQPSSPSPWRLHTVRGQSASLDFWIRHPGSWPLSHHNELHWESRMNTKNNNSAVCSWGWKVWIDETVPGVLSNTCVLHIEYHPTQKSITQKPITQKLYLLSLRNYKRKYIITCSEKQNKNLGTFGSRPMYVDTYCGIRCTQGSCQLTINCWQHAAFVEYLVQIFGYSLRRIEVGHIDEAEM